MKIGEFNNFTIHLIAYSGMVRRGLLLRTPDGHPALMPTTNLHEDPMDTDEVAIDTSDDGMNNLIAAGIAPTVGQLVEAGVIAPPHRMIRNFPICRLTVADPASGSVEP
jgi:hypothetical protein